MPYFLSPKVIFGEGALKRLGRELEGKGGRAVLITDRAMAPHSKAVVDAVAAAGVDVRVWDGAEPDPSVEVAQSAAEVLLETGPRWVIGFGGGSAIDTAKAAWVFYERPDLRDRPIIPKLALNLRRKAGFIAVPTTSGTGADVTWVAVLTDTARRKKIVLANNEMVPDISVLEPTLTASMPPDLTAGTGVDVLGHAIDGFISKQRNAFSDGLCLTAMKMAFEWLPAACRQGDDLVSREKMQLAATIAGLGFGNSNTGLSHALAHSVGAFFHVPHGRAVGVALPFSLEYILTAQVPSGAADPVERLSVAAGFVGIDKGSSRENVYALVEKIRNLSREIGEPLSLHEAGISLDRMKEGLDSLVRLASRDPNMFTLPCACAETDLRRIFLAMWEGKGALAHGEA